MPHPAAPVRLADFTVRLFLPDNILSDEDRVNTIVWALNNLNLKNRLARLVRYELETRRCSAAAAFRPSLSPTRRTIPIEPPHRHDAASASHPFPEHPP